MIKIGGNNSVNVIRINTLTVEKPIVVTISSDDKEKITPTLQQRAEQWSSKVNEIIPMEMDEESDDEGSIES